MTPFVSGKGRDNRAARGDGRAAIRVKLGVRLTGRQTDLHGRLRADLVGEDHASLSRLARAYPCFQRPGRAGPVEASAHRDRDAAGAGNLAQIQAAGRDNFAQRIHMAHGVDGAGDVGSCPDAVGIVVTQDLQAVQHAVFIRVIGQRIRAELLFLDIGQPVVVIVVAEPERHVPTIDIQVRGQRIPAEQELVVVAHGVAVDIGIGAGQPGVAELLELPEVGQAVVVAVTREVVEGLVPFLVRVDLDQVSAAHERRRVVRIVDAGQGTVETVGRQGPEILGRIAEVVKAPVTDHIRIVRQGSTTRSPQLVHRAGFAPHPDLINHAGDRAVRYAADAQSAGTTIEGAIQVGLNRSLDLVRQPEVGITERTVARNQPDRTGCAGREVEDGSHVAPTVRGRDVRVESQRVCRAIHPAVLELEVAICQTQLEVVRATAGIGLLNDHAGGIHAGQLDPGLNRHRRAQHRTDGDLRVFRVSGQLKGPIAQRTQTVQRIRALRHLIAIQKIIVIGVVVVRMRAKRFLLLVGEVVAVGIKVSSIRRGGIGAGQEFVEIADPVTVRISRTVLGKVAEESELPAVGQVVAIRIDLTERADVILDRGPGCHHPVHIPVIAGGEVFDGRAAVVERVVSRQSGLVTGQSNETVGVELIQATGRVPDTNFVQASDKGRTAQHESRIVHRDRVGQCSAVGVGHPRVRLRRLSRIGLDHVQGQRRAVGDGRNVAPLANLDLCVRHRGQRLVADREGNVTRGIMRQAVVGVGPSPASKHHGVGLQGNRLDPQLNREGRQVQLPLRGVHADRDRVGGSQIQSPQHVRAPAVQRVTLSAGRIGRRSAIVRTGDFLAIVKAVVIRVHSIRVRPVVLLLDVAQEVVVSISVEIRGSVAGARIEAGYQEFVEIVKSVTVSIGVTIDRTDAGQVRAREINHLPPVGHAVVVGISVEVGVGVIRCAVLGGSRKCGSEELGHVVAIVDQGRHVVDPMGEVLGALGRTVSQADSSVLAIVKAPVAEQISIGQGGAAEWDTSPDCKLVTRADIVPDTHLIQLAHHACQSTGGTVGIAEVERSHAAAETALEALLESLGDPGGRTVNRQGHDPVDAVFL